MRLYFFSRGGYTLPLLLDPPLNYTVGQTEQPVVVFAGCRPIVIHLTLQPSSHPIT